MDTADHRTDPWAAVAQGVSPAALRNAGPILMVMQDLLRAHLPDGGTALEIASGGGYHACVFGRDLPNVRWQPTEADPAALPPMAARIAAAGLANVAPPVALDVMAAPWPVTHADVIVCINMIHIAQWEATRALFAGAARLLPAGGLVITYGPYRIAGDYQADSNRIFDESLRTRNPAWGVRAMEDIADLAAQRGFEHILTRPMPANNHVLAFRKTP